MANKRNRSANFSYEEELELVNIIYQYKNILEGKRMHRASPHEKELIWQKIQESFNSKFPPREASKLKSKYDNLKTLSKKYALEKHKLISTTNGRDANIKPNPIYELILNIMNRNLDVKYEKCHNDERTSYDRQCTKEETTKLLEESDTNEHDPIHFLSEVIISEYDNSKHNNAHSTEDENTAAMGSSESVSSDSNWEENYTRLKPKKRYKSDHSMIDEDKLLEKKMKYYDLKIELMQLEIELKKRELQKHQVNNHC